MVVFDIDGKKILKVSLQMELDTLDKKIARVLAAREELHQAICDLFNSDVADVEGWTAKKPTDIKIKSLFDEDIFLKDADTRQQIINAVMNAISEAMRKRED